MNKQYLFDILCLIVDEFSRREEKQAIKDYVSELANHNAKYGFEHKMSQDEKLKAIVEGRESALKQLNSSEAENLLKNALKRRTEERDQFNSNLKTKIKDLIECL